MRIIVFGKFDVTELYDAISTATRNVYPTSGFENMVAIVNKKDMLDRMLVHVADKNHPKYFFGMHHLHTANVQIHFFAVIDDQDRSVMKTINKYLFGGQFMRLHRALRIENGIVYYITHNLDLFSAANVCEISIRTDPKYVQQAICIVLTELWKLRYMILSDETFETIKNAPIKYGTV